MSNKKDFSDYITKLAGIVRLYELKLITKDEYFALIRIVNKEYKIGENNGIMFP